MPLVDELPMRGDEKAHPVYAIEKRMISYALTGRDLVLDPAEPPVDAN